jgi:hypothetical protein
MRLYNKKILFLSIIFPVVIFVFSSCSTSTSLTSWKNNPEKECSFRKILVMVLIKDLEYKTSLESRLVSDLNKAGINSVKSLDVLSPVEKYSKDDLDSVLQKNNFDGLLTMKYEGSLIENEKRNGIKYYKYYRKFFKPIRRKGYIESHKTVIFESILFSAETENNIWVATTKTKDSSDSEDLALSVSEALIKDLIKNKLIK